MEVKYNRTCWQGIYLEHPADWELCATSGNSDAGSLYLGDRRRRRLRFYWRKLDYRPNLERLVDKRNAEDEENEEVEWRRVGLPGEWTGVIEKKGGASMLHSGRFFEDEGVLVEAIIFWPHGRNLEGEARILQSVGFAKEEDGGMPWKAMGLDALIPVEFAFDKYDSLAGKVAWEFKKKEKKPTRLTIERLGVPDYWLKSSMQEWLEAQLAHGSGIRSRNLIQWRNHQAVKILSTAAASGIRRIRGMYKVVLCVGWKCETENRVYRVVLDTFARDFNIRLPENLRVNCCKPAPVLEKSI